MEISENWVKMDTVEKLSADLNMTIQELEVQLAIGSIQTVNSKLLERFTPRTTSLRVKKTGGLSSCIKELDAQFIMRRTEVVGYTSYGSHTVALEVGGLAERIRKNGKGRIYYVITPTGRQAAKILADSALLKPKLVEIPVKINLARYYHYMISIGR